MAGGGCWLGKEFLMRAKEPVKRHRNLRGANKMVEHTIALLMVRCFVLLDGFRESRYYIK